MPTKRIARVAIALAHLSGLPIEWVSAPKPRAFAINCPICAVVDVLEGHPLHHRPGLYLASDWILHDPEVWFEPVDDAGRAGQPGLTCAGMFRPGVASVGMRKPR